jgi:hypothetical protein
MNSDLLDIELLSIDEQKEKIKKIIQQNFTKEEQEKINIISINQSHSELLEKLKLEN